MGKRGNLIIHAHTKYGYKKTDTILHYKCDDGHFDPDVQTDVRAQGKNIWPS